MEDLSDKLEVIRFSIGSLLHDAKVAQREKEDARDLRTFQPNDKILFHIPGLLNKLDAAWEGPYTVSKRVGDLDYVIKWTKNGKTHTRTVHINHLEAYMNNFWW